MGIQISYGNGQFWRESACPNMPDDIVMWTVKKMAESIKMLFWLCTCVGPSKHVLDGAQFPMQRGNHYGKNMPGHAQWQAAMSSAKWLNQSICHLGCWLRLAERRTSLIVFALCYLHHLCTISHPRVNENCCCFVVLNRMDLELELLQMVTVINFGIHLMKQQKRYAE